MAWRCTHIPGNPTPSGGCKGELEHPRHPSAGLSQRLHHHPFHKETSEGPTGLRNCYSLLTSGWICALCAGMTQEYEGKGIQWCSSSWSIIPQHMDMAWGCSTPQPWNSAYHLPGKVQTTVGSLGALEIPGKHQEGFNPQRTHPALLILVS